MTDKRQLFRRDPLLGHKSNKSRGQNLKIVLSKNHSQDTWKPGQQQHQKKYWPKFQGYQGKTLSFKSSNTKQNLLELTSMLQCKRSGSTCKGPVSNKSNFRSNSSKETKILLFKFGQNHARSEYPKYYFKICDFFSRKPCPGKIAQPSSFEPRTI